MTNNKSPSPTTNATPTEKLEALFNEKALRKANQGDASTFLSHTHSDEGGRFAKPQQVVGSKPAPEYPAGPNWSPQAVGIEPPLGFDINETPIVGEPHEIDASIQRLESERSADQSDFPPTDGPSVEAGSSVAHHDLERPPIPYPNKEPQPDRPSQHHKSRKP